MVELVSMKVEKDVLKYIEKMKIIPQEPAYKVLRRLLGLEKKKVKK